MADENPYAKGGDFESQRQQAKKKVQKDIDDTAVYVQDTLVSVAAKVGEVIIEAVENAIDGADATAIGTVGKDLTRSFKQAAKFSDEFAANNNKINQGILTSSDIEKQRNKLADKRAALERKANLAKAMGVDINEEDLQNAYKSLDVQDQALAKDQARTDGIAKQMGATGEVMKRLSKTPFFGSLLNAEEGLKRMRSEVANNADAYKGFGGSVKLIGKGIGSAFKGIEKASIVLFVIKKVIDAFKFLISLMAGAQEKTVKLGQNLGMSRDNAKALKVELQNVANESDKLYLNTERLIAAQLELNKELNRGGRFMASTLEDTVFLQQRLGISADVANKFVAQFEQFGMNSKEGLDNIIATRNELFNSGESVSTLNQVIQEVAGASGSIRAQFGFSVEALARGAQAARRMGLTLAQTQKISESQLDFEKSIAAEMEAEQLIGKDINFDRVRLLANQGKSVEASKLAMKEFKKLTAEQRKLPVIQQSFADLLGLSKDELMDAYALQYDATRIAQQQIINQKLFKEELAEINKMQFESDELKEKAIAKLQKELNIEDAKRTSLEANVTAAQAFKESMTKLKNQFQTFVGSGALDQLTDQMPKFVNLLTDFIARASQVGIGRAIFGGGDSLEEQQQDQRNKDRIAELNKKVLEKQAELMAGGMRKSTTRYDDDILAMNREIRDIKRGALDVAAPVEKKEGDVEVPTEDFVIKPLGRDTITMAGGTKLGGNVEKLLQDLIKEVKKGGNVFLDGEAVGKAMTMGTTTI